MYTSVTASKYSYYHVFLKAELRPFNVLRQQCAKSESNLKSWIYHFFFNPIQFSFFYESINIYSVINQIQLDMCQEMLDTLTFLFADNIKLLLVFLLTQSHCLLVGIQTYIKQFRCGVSKPSSNYSQHYKTGLRYPQSRTNTISLHPY